MRLLPQALLPTKRNPMGSHFTIGNTRLYIGPDPRGTNYRPVLAFWRDGMAEPGVVAAFVSEERAEEAVAALSAGIDELNALHKMQIAEAVLEERKKPKPRIPRKKPAAVIPAEGTVLA